MKKIITFSILLSSIVLHAQNMKKADRLFRDLSYVEAATAYEKYIDKAEEPELQAYKNLADSYYYLNDDKNALKWYKKIYEIVGSNISDEYYMKYIQSMRGVRDYEDAYVHTKKYYKRKGDSALTAKFIAQKKRLDSLSEVESLYSIKNLDINSAGSDFGPAFYESKLVYSSTKDSAQFGKSLYSWNKQPFLDLYVADRNGSNGSLYNARPFMTGMSSKFHDATLSFADSATTVYYTTNITKKKNRLFLNDERTNNFQIMKGTIKDEKLVSSKPIFVDNPEYSVGHPSVSDDGKLLFFVSDMEGGEGETDIYVVELFEDGTMNSPKNLGSVINTEGKEMFPFYSDSTLYFSSTGHFGLGGLDIFESKNKGDLNFSSPKNLGKPMNSNRDDFSFIIDTTGSYGYFASNRLENTKGDDDIYYFTKEMPPCDQFISGTAIDSITKLPLREVIVKAYDKFEEVIAETKTDDDGMYKLTLPCGATYKLFASKENYTTDEEEVATTKEHEAKIEGVDFELTNYDDLVKKENGIEKISVNVIYFDYDKSNITAQAAEELDKVVFVMREFPDVKIKIESHTDSRGADSYNMALSDRRAKSTQAYIISKGIDPERIESAIGYGETRLVNDCGNGVDCSDEEHALNRRSDFIVIEK